MIHYSLAEKNFGLGKAIHTLSNFNNDVKIANKRGNIVFLNDGLGDSLDRYGRVFIAVEGCAKIDFFEVSSHELVNGCLYCAVEEAFDGDKIRSFSADITGVVDEITTNSPSYDFSTFRGFSFFSHYAKISGSANLGNVCMLNKRHIVCAGWNMW